AAARRTPRGAPRRWGSGRESGSCLPPRDAGRPREQSAEGVVELGQDRALDSHLHRLDGLGGAEPVDHEGARELLRALVRGCEPAEREDFPALCHGRYLTPMVIALDVGTSSARATLYDGAGRPVPGRFHQIPYAPALTPGGGVEHDPSRLLDAVVACLVGVSAGPPADVRGVGVTTFWHGLLGFDAAGRPATPAYTWADTRSHAEVQPLRDTLDEDALHARTGCHLHASYWPAKLRWLQRRSPEEALRVARWGSVGELLELAFFGEAGTSVSMASGTGLLDQTTSAWDPQAVAAAAIEPKHLFPLCDRTEGRRGLRAPWAGRWPGLARVPWFPAVGDGAASNVGSGSTRRRSRSRARRSRPWRSGWPSSTPCSPRARRRATPSSPRARGSRARASGPRSSPTRSAGRSRGRTKSRRPAAAPRCWHSRRSGSRRSSARPRA